MEEAIRRLLVVSDPPKDILRSIGKLGMAMPLEQLLRICASMAIPELLLSPRRSIDVLSGQLLIKCALSRDPQETVSALVCDAINKAIWEGADPFDVEFFKIRSEGF